MFAKTTQATTASGKFLYLVGATAVALAVAVGTAAYAGDLGPSVEQGLAYHEHDFPVPARTAESRLALR